MWGFEEVVDKGLQEGFYSHLDGEVYDGDFFERTMKVYAEVTCLAPIG